MHWEAFRLIEEIRQPRIVERVHILELDSFVFEMMAAGCVTLDQSFNLSELLFLQLWNWEDNNSVKEMY